MADLAMSDLAMADLAALADVARAAPAVRLTQQLAGRLGDEGVRYCHWKSNLAIARSESAENDLDLLVDERDVEAFRRVLDELGFTETHSAGGDVPGTASYYAFAPDGGRWVNVHAHYRLVLGHDRTKNHRLPAEHLFLEHATPTGSFLPTPPLELEYIVLVVRLVLKYAIADEIAWAGMRRQPSRPKKTERAELADLRDRVDAAGVRDWLLRIDGGPSVELFSRCEAVLDDGASLRSRVRTAAELERALAPYATVGRWTDARLRVWRRIDLAARRRLGALTGNRRVRGGLVMAVMGGDGSGKTTLITELSSWLRGGFEVRNVHMGKPPWSMTTKVVRGLLMVTDRALGGSRATRSDRRPGRAVSLLLDYRPLIWFALTARDRRRLHAEFRRFAAAGGIVVCDRYPHEKLVEMDVPQIRRVTEGAIDNWFVRRLMRAEERAHATIRPPDLTIVLRVDPEIAVVRKVEETAESVRRRGAEIWTADWSTTDVHVIDASRPRDEVAATARSIVAEALR